MPIRKIKKQLFVLIVLIISHSSKSFSQIEPSATEEQKLETVVENSAGEIDLSELQEKRNYLANHPLNINFSDREEILASGLLNEFQATALLQHICQCGILLNIEELQSINEFPLELIREIQPFIKTGKAMVDAKFTPSTMLGLGKSEIILRNSRVTEQQTGYQKNKYGITPYAGDPWKTYMRYRYTVGSYFSFGITAEKDAGEQFFKGTQTNGFDFYSAHLFIKPGNFVHTIALGDYQLQYGQGLVVWSGLTYGKGPEAVLIKRQAAGITPYSSVNEFSFLRGIAISTGRKNVTADFWFSNHKLDANLHYADTTNTDLQFSYINQAGYHRTTSELSDKGSLQQRIAGTHIGYCKNNLTIGFTSQYSDYNHAFSPGNSPYQIYDYSGKVFLNSGINYSYLFRNFNFFGETGTDRQSHLATVNGLMAILDSKFSVSILVRSYPQSYQAVNANPFRENTNPHNEAGMYYGFQYIINNNYKLTGYVDYFKFPWMKYNVTAPTSGSEWLTQLTVTPSRNTEIYFRLKNQNKPLDASDVNQNISFPAADNRLNMRINFRSKLSTDFTFQSRVEWMLYRPSISSNEAGTLFMEDLRWHPMGKPWHVSVCYALFKTNSYSSRVYGYEEDVPGAYSIPGYYYEGHRYYLLCRYRITRGVDIWLKYSRTNYTNQQTIGTGYELISAPHRSEIKIQIRYIF